MRQLKPPVSPGVRFGLFEGGVVFGESDIIVKKIPSGVIYAVEPASVVAVREWARLPHRSEKQNPFLS